MGRVEGIWIKRMRKGPMDPADSATFIADAGIVGCANQGGHRQVTVIEAEVFERLRESLPDAAPIMRRANIMVSGIPLRETRGQVLSFGGVRLLIKGETRPCERMDEQCPGLTAALSPDWHGGVYGIVLDNGEVQVGDVAELTAQGNER
jgi:MOSC domain-containing protein YiiM